RPERFPWFQCAGAFRRTTAPVIHPMGTSSRTLARIGIALDIPCGIALRPLLKLLHQTLQQPRARFDRGEQHIFMIRVCAVAIDAKPVQGRDDPVALATTGELASESADRMYGIHMAEYQDAWLVARRITAHQQHVAERIRRQLTLQCGAGSLERPCDRFEYAIDTRRVARRTLDCHDVAY